MEALPVPATASMPKLADDVLLEILALVADDDEAALFRCAATCHRWRRLIADPTFLRRCWPASALVGFFTHHSVEQYDPGNRRCTCTVVHGFIPALRSPRSPVTRILGSFVPAADALLEQGTPLASRGALILLRAVNRSYCSAATLRLSVCNPLAGSTRDLLPPLEQFRVLYYALLLAGADFRSSKLGLSYKVVLIGISNGDIKKYTILTFSSGDPSWSMPESCLMMSPPGGYGLWALQGQGTAVVTQGMAHWFLRDASSFYIQRVSATTCEYSLKKLSISSSQLPLGSYKYDEPRLNVTSDGTLVLVCTHKYDFHVVTWTRREDGEIVDSTEEWTPTRHIKLTKPQHMYMVRCLCTVERGSTLLIADSCIDERLYSANLDTAQVDQITDDSHPRYTSAEPFEVDWPTFFMSRIGVQQ